MRREVLFSGFLALLVLLPVPFGSNRPWASDLFAVLAALLLMATAFHVYRKPSLWPEGAPLRRLGLGVFFMALVVLWAVLQTQSWMPADWHHPLWTNVVAPDAARQGAIADDPDAMPESLARLLGYVAIFFVSFIFCRDATRAEKLVRALAVAAAVYAFYGLLMQSTGLKKILWFDKWAYADSVTSTFVNKNSYATYAGLGLLCCLAVLWLRFKNRPVVHTKPSAPKGDWLENFFRHYGLALFMSLLVLGALLLSGSRAGLASFFAGGVSLLFVLALHRRWSWTRWAPVLLAGFALIAGLSLFNETASLNQLDHKLITTDGQMRLAAYDVALRAIKSNPLLGFGLGSFDSAFRLYRDSTVGELFQHAHNDYLELFIELGVPAGFLLLLAVALMVSCCAGGALKRKRRVIFPALALAATVLVGAHSFVDFSLQIPAVAATYAALLGMGVAQSWSSRGDGKRAF